MPHTKLAGACALALAASLSPAAGWAETLHSKASAIKISHPWARPTPPGAPTGAGYVTIANTSRTPDRLLDATVDVADHVELHQMTIKGGVMRMRPVSDGVAIPPGATVKLEPGGYHLMLIGPKRPLKLGEHIPATLRFERAGEVRVEFQVEQPAAASLMPHAAGAN